MDEEVKSWNVCFHKDFHDWEVEIVNSFFNHIYSRVPSGGYSMRWRLNGSGKFNVQSYYKDIHGASGNIFPCKSIWCVKAPKSVSFSLLMVVWVKVVLLSRTSL